jgi:hypothetical protein
MAQIRLYRSEVKEGRLPRICMRCGAEADAERRRDLTWYPPWVNLLVLIGVLPAAIVAMILTKRMTVYAPVCANHKNHWLVRSLIIYGGLVGIILLALGAVFVLAMADQGGGRGQPVLTGIVCGGSVLLLIVWLVVVAIAQSTAIRPKEITDKTITLTGVSEEFVNTLGEDDDEEDERPSRPKPRGTKDDTDGMADLGEPRRRRPSSDSFREEE